MVVYVPMIKVVVLLYKQIAKPITSVVKNQARKHPFFRRYAIRMGQWVGRINNWATARNMGIKGKPFTPISEERAVEAGAELVGEATVIGVGISAIFIERYYDAKSKKIAKDALETRLDELEAQNKESEKLQKEYVLESEEDQARLRELTRLCYNLQDRIQTLEKQLENSVKEGEKKEMSIPKEKLNEKTIENPSEDQGKTIK